MRTAQVTLSIDIDAFAPALNDATVNVSQAILDRLNAQPGGEVYNVVEHTPEKLIISMWLEGDFEEIHP